MELRARTVDVLTENYYQVLCAFFINKANYRRGKNFYDSRRNSSLDLIFSFLAAFYFYELAQRFKLETNTSESLKFRVAALSGCVTNLSLIREEFRWIVRPENQKKVRFLNQRLVNLINFINTE